MQTEAIAEALIQLNQNTPDIDGSLLVASDGAAVASMIDPQLDPAKLAALSAPLAALGLQFGLEASLDDVEQMMVKGRNGYFLVLPVTRELFLCVLLKSGSKPGLVSLEARTTGERIRGLL